MNGSLGVGYARVNVDFAAHLEAVDLDKGWIAEATAEKIAQQAREGTNAFSAYLKRGVTPEAEGSPENVEQPKAEEQKSSTSSRIPVSEDGKKLYEQATPEDTFDSLVEELGDESAATSIAERAAKAAQKALDRANEELDKAEEPNEMVEKTKAVRAAQQKIDFWNQVAITEKKRKAEAERRAEEGNANEQESSANTNEAKAEREKKASDAKTDSQGNPINADGTLKLEKIASVDELTDEDFSAPTRNVELPELPKNVNDAIGAGGKKVVIKKNIFEKNKKSHKDLTPSQSREIVSSALYHPNLYGQNQKTTRPYNWILIHNAKKHSSVILEVNHNKENIEIVNWHYLDDATLKQKERQAVKEGGLILTLESVAGNTQNDLSSEDKGTKNKPAKQGRKKESNTISGTRERREGCGETSVAPQRQGCSRVAQRTCASR